MLVFVLQCALNSNCFFQVARKMLETLYRNHFQTFSVCNVLGLLGGRSDVNTDQKQ